MIIYHNDCTEPYENMATEEYLLDSAGEEDIFMLWRNEPADYNRTQSKTRTRNQSGNSREEKY